MTLPVSAQGEAMRMSTSGDQQNWSRRDVLGATALLLTGCGGGGEAPAPVPGPTVPSASLTLVTPAMRLSAGGAAQRVQALLSGASGTVFWSLSGPGSLSESRGLETLYTPPRSDLQRVNAEARITASTAGLVQEVRLEVSAAPGAPAPVPGTEWDTVSRPKGGVLDIQWLGGRFWAVTWSGAVLFSLDGIVWTACRTVPCELNAITLGDNGFVAVGRDALLHSRDGLSWTRVTWSGHHELHDVVAGNGVFVAIGPRGLVFSRDGLDWVPLESTGGMGYGSSLAFGAGQFMAVRPDAVAFTSPDGETWTAQSLPAARGETVAVGYGRGRFVVVTDDVHLSSIDGRVWAQHPSLAIRGDRIRFSGTRFFLRGRLAGFLGLRMVYSSGDGQTWSPALSSAFSGWIGGIAEHDGRQVAGTTHSPIQLSFEGGAVPVGHAGSGCADHSLGCGARRSAGLLSGGRPLSEPPGTDVGTTRAECWCQCQGCRVWPGSLRGGRATGRERPCHQPEWSRLDASSAADDGFLRIAVRGRVCRRAVRRGGAFR